MEWLDSNLFHPCRVRSTSAYQLIGRSMDQPVEVNSKIISCHRIRTDYTWGWPAGRTIYREFFLHQQTRFFFKSQKRFIVEYCDWSHLKGFLLEKTILEFHWFRKIISQWNCPITEKSHFPPFLFLFLRLQEKTSTYRNDFDTVECVFELCILCQNFKFLFIVLLW